jgi:hypothetical protein
MADADQSCGGKAVPDLLALAPLLNVVRWLLAQRTENVFDITFRYHRWKSQKEVLNGHQLLFNAIYSQYRQWKPKTKVRP